MNNEEKNLLREYSKRQYEIKNRLNEFSVLHNASDYSIFSELCFCISTANANASKCGDAIERLKRSGLLLKGRTAQLRRNLKGLVRFHNKKADYMVCARKLFTKGACLDIKSMLKKENIIATRDWLVENVKGFGYKEASHFLRNIGLGKDIAILDRHILKNLKKHKVIDRIPESVGPRRTYLDIEDKMRAFSKRIGIPMDELDLLFWSIQTGFVFK